jgi:hypothetical protein
MKAKLEFVPTFEYETYRRVDSTRLLAQKRELNNAVSILQNKRVHVRLRATCLGAQSLPSLASNTAIVCSSM